MVLERMNAWTEKELLAIMPKTPPQEKEMTSGRKNPVPLILADLKKKETFL